MSNRLLFLVWLSIVLPLCATASHVDNIHVNEGDIINGYLIRKVWLDNSKMPTVAISAEQYVTDVLLPTGAKLTPLDKYKISIGVDRKKSFALIAIPLFSQMKDGKGVQQLTDFTLTVTEAPNATEKKPVAKTTAGQNSVLAAGSWYKIAIGNTGFYKIDFNFIKDSLKIDPTTINTANIRVFGNGGVMLDEANYMPRPANLTENAIWVNDGGDGKMNQGDYFVFYGVGSMGWTKDSIKQRFRHRANLYDDKAYYFISFNQGAGLRIGLQAGALAGNKAVTDYNDYVVHERDSVSFSSFGKEWWGEVFNSLSSGTSHTYNFNLGTLTEPAHIKVMMGNTGSDIATFNVSVNSQLVKTYGLSGAGNDEFSSLATINDTNEFNVGITGSGTTSVKIDYESTGTSSIGYLNYIEINTRRALTFQNGQVSFRDWRSVGNGNVAQYQLTNANSNVQVWDITNAQVPVKMSGTLNGSTYIFTQEAERLHEFAATDGTGMYTPSYLGTVDNQNLHGLGPIDYVIVTHPDFIAAANKLAEFHRNKDNMRVAVVTTKQVYNEFSSGSQDISAIRDFMKMLYDNALDSTQMPKYLLLFGAASYDYKDRISGNNNLVPIFESAESLVKINSYSGDDFFGFLDDNENIEEFGLLNTLDIGIGRITARTEAAAMDVVDKIINYKSAASLGPWRISTTFVGDDEDAAGDHLSDAEMMSKKTAQAAGSDVYNKTKVFLDILPSVSTPGGDRCPSANSVINNQIYKGTFLMNYNGHGNTDVWSHERVLSTEDYTLWKNYNKLPFVITATCDFGQYDNPILVSSAEKLVLKNDGGAIALITTTASTFAEYNKTLDTSYLIAQITRKDDESYNAFGDAVRISKNHTYYINSTFGLLINFRKFSLLGDPALVPDFPQYYVTTDSVKDGVTNQPVDTFSALGSYKVNGSVRRKDGSTIQDFNGTLYVSIYDKPRTFDIQTKLTNARRVFQVQDNIIYKGKISVINGHFSYSFIAPKDINYAQGKGKISYYAENGVTDAASSDSSYYVGGFSDNPVSDDEGPVIQPYINDSLFRDGGITGSNTLLYVKLYDKIGINVAGNGVGHDMTAVLDGNVANPYILNEYYESAANNYQVGYVSFPITGLSEGAHTLTVKAWDVNDNSGEGTVHFVVVRGAITEVKNLMNYPNPFSTLTHFVFEHNHPEEDLNVKINIYNTSGVLVRTISQKFTPNGSRSNEVTWDGTEDGGAPLPTGVYIYRLTLSTLTGVSGSAYQKLVLVR
jgi:hypothetical protein